MTITGDNVATMLPTVLWFIVALIVIWVFKDAIKELLQITLWRVKTGSQLKIASFELGASYVSPQNAETPKGGIIDVHVDKKDARYQERRQYYEPNRRIFLVHRIAPSKNPGELYDIALYLIPHQDANLASVQKVEYYLGKYWANRVFTSIDRANGFLISTSAYGPFVCTAKVYFTDGESCMIWRYVDFEMGPIGKEPSQ